MAEIHGFTGWAFSVFGVFDCFRWVNGRSGRVPL